MSAFNQAYRTMQMYQNQARDGRHTGAENTAIRKEVGANCDDVQVQCAAVDHIDRQEVYRAVCPEESMNILYKGFAWHQHTSEQRTVF
jgi:hypothetical protein